ncbi:MAG: O-antigen ligase family protein [Pseudomonadota bacterium]
MLRLLFIVVALELFLGGGGRLWDLGPVSLRMLLFTGTLGLMLFPQFWRRVGDDAGLAYGMVALFLVVHLPAVFVGLARGVEPGVVFGEIQPMLYWLMAPFFAQVLSGQDNVVLTAKLVRGAGLLLAVAYLVALVAILTGYVDFLAAYRTLNDTGEFFFRGGQGLFVYKGFLYLCIALVFFVAIPGRLKPLTIALIGAALLLTLTRGFILSTGAALLMLLWATGRKKLLAAFVIGGALAALALALASLSQGSILVRTDTGVSNAIRFKDINFMLANVDKLTLFTGHGFGSYISGDRLNIENSYLWIWWKTGIPGLLFWLAPLLVCILAFKRIPAASRSFPYACAYFFSVVLIYMQTATNPYLQNPIGLSFLIMATFSLRTLARREAGTATEPAPAAASGGRSDG